MNKNTIKHVFFDLDHTLWDFDKNSALTFEKIFRLNNISIPIEDFIKHYEPINLAYWRLYRHNNIDKTSLRYGRLKDSFDTLNVEISDELIDKLSEDYITHLSTFNHLFTNTIEILNYLQKKYALHIITNGFHEVQEKKMRHSKIFHYFKTITDSEMVGVKKPNPKIFEFALDQAKALPNESIMIGDSLEADAQGALDYGLHAIWFNYKKEDLQQNITCVSELIELKQYL